MSDAVPEKGEWVIPICAYCLHDRQDGTCIAYPAGIPYRILAGYTDHAKVQVDQTGATVFEHAPGRPTPDRSRWAAE
jgi:hypothetical protein